MHARRRAPEWRGRRRPPGPGPGRRRDAWQKPIEHRRSCHWQPAPQNANLPSMLIQVLIYDGFDELDAIGPYEILHGAGFDTQLAVLEATRTITASHGTVIAPHAVLSERPDLLLVPGGGWVRGEPTSGTRFEYDRDVIP